jgi:hypothetical protein
MKSLRAYLFVSFFYKVAMDTTGPFLETKGGNKYIIAAIDHYFKWNEAKAIPNHGVKTATRFLEDEIICRYVVPKFIIIDNVGEW